MPVTAARFRSPKRDADRMGRESRIGETTRLQPMASTGVADILPVLPLGR